MVQLQIFHLRAFSLASGLDFVGGKSVRRLFIDKVDYVLVAQVPQLQFVDEALFLTDLQLERAGSRRVGAGPLHRGRAHRLCLGRGVDDARGVP